MIPDWAKVSLDDLKNVMLDECRDAIGELFLGLETGEIPYDEACINVYLSPAMAEYVRTGR